MLALSEAENQLSCVCMFHPVSHIQGPISTFQLTDAGGSIRYLTNSQGHLISSTEYNFLGLPQQPSHSDLSLGYANGLFFLKGKILMLGGQTYWLPLARVLTAPAVKPGTNELSQTNPLPFSLVNMNHPIQ